MSTRRGPATTGRGPSMADVAKVAGVSHQTVSRVLNDSPLVRDDTRARVQSAIEELGYRRNHAARLLATNRSRRIGMVAAALGHHGPSAIAHAVQEAAHASDYEVSLIGLRTFDDAVLTAAIDRLLDQAAEAIVIAVAHREAGPIVQRVQVASVVPLVVIQGVQGDEPFAAAIDQQAGARLATEHLLSLGHRRVAHLSGPLDWVEAFQRREGWKAAHDAAGGGRLPGPELEGDWTPASGYRHGLRIAEDPDITAVFAANDAMALGLMQALHERGRTVPDDVSVVGFDDVPESAYYWPALTTVAQEFNRLGSTAVELALRAIAGAERLEPLTSAPRLVVRASTTPPTPERRAHR